MPNRRWAIATGNEIEWARAKVNENRCSYMKPHRNTSDKKAYTANRSQVVSIHDSITNGHKRTFAHLTFSPANYIFTEDASASGAAKTINGNNNFELTEFDTKAPTYR